MLPVMSPPGVSSRLPDNVDDGYVNEERWRGDKFTWSSRLKSLMRKHFGVVSLR